MNPSLSDIIALHRMLNTADARTKLASKSNKNSQRQKQLRAYTNAQINQRKHLHNIIRIKHK